MLFRHLIIAAATSGSMAEFAIADEINPGSLPAGAEEYVIPPLPAFDSAIMGTAFRDMPRACRTHVQSVLAGLHYYRGPIDGSWGVKTGAAIARYVGEVGNLGYGLATVPGSKGIIWHIGFAEMGCPMPPYSS